MMWVKLTLPAEPVRISWLLRMVRLTSRRRAGTTRKLVAVGTDRLAVIFATTRAAAPRSGRAAGSASSGTSVAGAGRSGAALGGAAGGGRAHRLPRRRLQRLVIAPRGRRVRAHLRGRRPGQV